MTDDEKLIARLRARAAEERVIQRNNEVVTAALMGQRLLFDQGIRSASNTFAVRLGLEYETCAKNDAKLARDWDAAADRIEALTAKVKLMDDLDAINGEKIEALEAKLAKAVEALDMLVRDCEADYPPSHGAIKHFAIATLAEIKEESHEALP